MTELQIGLIGLGALAIFCVLAYNRWQESRHRRLAEEVLAASHSDVLLDGAERDDYDEAFDELDDVPPLAERDGGERREPVLQSFAHPEQGDDEPSLSTAEQPNAATPAAPSIPVPRPPAREVASKSTSRAATVARPEVQVTTPPPALLSPLVDYIIPLETVEPISAANFMRTERTALLHVTKRLTWIGFDESVGEWQRMEEESSSEYRRVRVGVQLADRRGPLSAPELTAFQMALQRVADEFMAFADMPPHQVALDTAQTLDAFCASVDNQVGVNIVPKANPLAGTKIRALAEAAGMILEPDGVFVMRARGVEREFGQLGHHASHQRERRLLVAVQPHQALHHHLAQDAQRGAGVVAAFAQRNEGTGHAGPVGRAGGQHFQLSAIAAPQALAEARETGKGGCVDGVGKDAAVRHEQGRCC